MATRTPSPLAAAQGRLNDAAAAHLSHRHICRQRVGCAECTSLARTVLRLQQQVGLMRFDRWDPEDDL